MPTLPLLRATGPFDQAIADLRAFDTSGVLTARIDALEAIGRFRIDVAFLGGGALSPDGEITEVEIPTGNPLLIELDANLKPMSARYLDEARAEDEARPRHRR